MPVHRLALVLVALVGLSLAAPRGGAAATCQTTCMQQLAACKQTCTGGGQARRDCGAACAERSTCTAPARRSHRAVRVSAELPLSARCPCNDELVVPSFPASRSPELGNSEYSSSPSRDGAGRCSRPPHLGLRPLTHLPADRPFDSCIPGFAGACTVRHPPPGPRRGHRDGAVPVELRSRRRQPVWGADLRDAVRRHGDSHRRRRHALPSQVPSSLGTFLVLISTGT